MSIQKVLVVDDSATDLSNIQSIVSNAGYQVITASGGKEAIAAANTHKPDLVFLDVIMPDIDGYETCREINSQHKGIPVVFVTSKNQKADKVWAQMQGGSAYVTKPYAPEDILDQIKAFQ